MEKSTFSGASCFRLIIPDLRDGSCGKELFTDFFDVRGGWTAPMPPAAADLPLKVAVIMGREVLFLEGSISNIDEAF